MPGGWSVQGARATRGGDLLEVRTYPLAKPYSPALFETARPEIERAAHSLQRQLKASFAERTVTVAGGRALQFDLAHGDVLERVTFLLHDKTEYELYCRLAKSADTAPCDRLVASFRLT